MFESERTTRLGRHGWTRLSALLLALLCLGATSAFAETRSLKIHHLHTGEKAEIIYKRNGRYDQAGLQRINVILRDWRRNEPIKMDPRLLDLVWQAYRASGSKSYIKVVSGYRAPATNAMLRSRSKGVARKSQHMLGKAMDFFLPDVPLKKLRNIGLTMQAGGVGYYPNSGSPFIHLDVGNVRHWPGISRQELAGLFPDGKTLHVPNDGKPLPGYAQALAAYKTRQANGAPAVALASAGGSGNKAKKQGLLAALFNGGEDEADDMADVARAAPVPRKAVKAAPRPAEAAASSGIAIVPPEKAQRAQIPVIGEQSPAPDVRPVAPETVVASLSSVPLPAFAPRQPTQAATIPFAIADSSSDIAGQALPKPAGPRPQDAAVEVAALAVPLPTWRPDHQPTAEVAAAEPRAPDAVAALLAMELSDDEPAPTASQPVSVPLPSAADRARATPKTGRVTTKVNQPEAPVVVAASMQTGSWPLAVDSVVTGAVPRQKAPRLSASFIRTAPQHAYVTGFNKDRTPVDHSRFTGSAVNFLPVARFN